ncbi:sodium/hydrogen exchanger 8 [Selaginella moellendorffii]|uniref:sodium/hydrogen exchanger 8 n=1 Tax=Selaginella moellendorffii TaxID=88036 RepID=UPI000D1C231D|nr:sodium/hydrogen exchanger 8 [Selaginella moellendorffii]|eukprot:XP_024527647.1 sodium/hydrogen exchanger 8 [Selaginella moellendorffii]
MASQDDQSDHGGEGPEIAILFVVVAFFIGTLSRQMLGKIKVPYTVVLLVIGIGLGSLEHGTHRGLGALGQSIRMWSKINPNLILFVFLPALLFDSSFSMEFHQIKRCIIQMLLLAVPGVIISTVCLALVHHCVFPYGWNWSISLLLGGLLSATDPVAVVALLKDLGASKKLNTIIDGEALMNDGTAMVVFELFHQMAMGKHFSPGDVIEFLSKVSLLALGLGLIIGMITVLWLGFIFNDTVMEITLTFTASYFAFFLAQSVAEVSGVLAVMTVGMFLAAFARTAFRGESQQAMHHFWNMVAYFANTIIFLLSGVVIAENILRSQSLIEARDWGYLVLLYLFVQLSRALVVAVLYPGLRYYGYGLSLKEATVLVWAGLRGAVALALSLSVNVSGNVSEITRAKFVFFTGGVVFLTLTINGTTTQFLLRFLRMEKTTDTKRLVLEHVMHDMNMKAVEAYEELGEDEELGPADMTTVYKYIGCLNQFGRGHHPHGLAPNVEDSRSIQLQDTRLRFLNGVQAAYWQMLEEGRISENAALLLMQSVDEALDGVAKQEELSDWTGLRPYVHIPKYLKLLQSKRPFFPQKLVHYLVVERLELGCYVTAAFLRAHVYVRRHIRDFIGETEVTKAVIKESEDEELEAKRFLEDIRLTFSQVLRVVKTKQVVHAILVRLHDYIRSLEKSGLLEEKETVQLSDAIQLELKKLLRKPPTVKIPKGSQVLRDHPFIAALPDHIQAQLVSCAKQCLKLRGNVICEEGSRADGLWLIANGVVKWSKRNLDKNRSLHPVFAHGSTLGLYEVLMGMPYLCELTADSVVQCFFLEASKVLSICRSEPRLEHYFWQESTLAISKIILPETFELLAMHELRLVFESSSTTVSCLRGEVVELRPGETALLVDGFIKRDESDEIIAAPSAVVCPHRASLQASDGIYYGSVLDVVARSRLIIIRCDLFTATSSMSLLPRRSSLGRDSFIQRARMSSFDRKPRSGRARSFATFFQPNIQRKKSSTSQIRPEQQQEKPAAYLSLHETQLASLPSIPVSAHLAPLRTQNRRNDRAASRDSSDASDDEHIVEIESPSGLSFNNVF